MKLFLWLFLGLFLGSAALSHPLKSSEPKAHRKKSVLLSQSKTEKKAKQNTSISSLKKVKTSKVKVSFVPKKKAQEKKKVKEEKKKQEKSLSFLRPVAGSIIADYGVLKNGALNDGINIAAPKGTKVKATEKGMVLYGGNNIPSYGNLILIQHQEGWISVYAHLKTIDVQKGKQVKRGEVIGTVGATGHVQHPQLHFELRKDKVPQNPLSYIGK